MDCGFIVGDQWFRLRACGIIVNNNQVLMSKNIEDDYYYAVGGAIQHGESSEQAVIREVQEETGLNLEIDRLLFIHENFFKTSTPDRATLCHEVSFYYLMKYNGEPVVSGSKNMYGVDELVEWIDLQDYEISQAYPLFYAQLKDGIPENTQHIVEIDRQIKGVTDVYFS